MAAKRRRRRKKLQWLIARSRFLKSSAPLARFRGEIMLPEDSNAVSSTVGTRRAAKKRKNRKWRKGFHE